MGPRTGVGQEREHLMIDGVPVQFLPAYNALVEEAVTTARVHDYEGADVRPRSMSHPTSTTPASPSTGQPTDSAST